MYGQYIQDYMDHMEKKRSVKAQYGVKYKNYMAFAPKSVGHGANFKL